MASIVSAVQKVTRYKPPYMGYHKRQDHQQAAIKRHFTFSKKTKAGKINRKETAKRLKLDRKHPTRKYGIKAGIRYHKEKIAKLGHPYYQ